MAPSKFSMQRLVALLLTAPLCVVGQSSKTITIHSCLIDGGVEAAISTDANWVNATASFQFRIPREPATVAFPKDKDQIATALRCARESRAKVSVVSRAHSFQGSGYGNPGNVVINVGAFTELSYDKATKQLTYGAAADVGPTAKYLNDIWGAHTPHVRGSNVGNCGSTFGGGFGTTSRFLGIPTDNLVCVEFMLANGTIVKALPGSDLLWAAQGAGPSFGVALSATVKTFDIPYATPLNYTLDFGRASVATGAAGFLAIQKWALDGLAPKELSLRFNPGSFGSAGFFYGSEKAFDEAFAPLLTALEAAGVQATLTKTVQPSFWASEVVAAGPGMDLPDGGPLGGRASLVQSWVTTTDHPFTPEQVTALFQGYASFNRTTDLTRSALIDLWGASSTTVKDGDHSYAHGNNLWLARVDIIARTQWPSDGVAYAESLFTGLEAALLKSGPIRGFPNYVSSELPQEEWISRLYGKNIERLQRIKAAVDPEEVFSGYKLAIPLKK